MPRRGEPAAPKFDSPSNLSQFWDDLELCFEDAGLKLAEDKFTWTFRYLDMDNRELWKSISAHLPPGTPDKWDAFKTKIAELYPDADPDRRHTIFELEWIIAKYKQQGFKDRSDIGDYYCEFTRVSNYLIDKGRYTANEARRAFLRGFPLDFQDRLLARLSITVPDTFPEDGYDIEIVFKTSKHMLGSGVSTTPSSILEPTPVEQKFIKLEETFNNFMQRVETHLNDRNARPSNPRTPNTACMFCGGTGHFVSRCPDASAYETANKIKRINGKIGFPDGILVYAPMGTTMKSLVDEWHTKNSPTLAINILKVNSNGNIVEIDPQDEIASLIQKLATEDSPDDRARLYALLGASPTPSTSNNKPDYKKQQKRPAAAASAPSNPPRRSDDRQFRYASALEDSSVAQKVLDTTLNAPIQITPREILAIAPKLRKQLNQLTSAKKIPINANLQETASYAPDTSSSYEQYHVHCHEDRDKLHPGPVTYDFLSLRSIDAIFADRIKADCILDSGSQFIAMRRDIWERTGVPLLGERGASITTANNSTSHTMGLVENMKMNIGPLTLYIKLQVIDDAPFEVLLGRPFFAYLSCVTKDYPNGNQYITIEDPHTTEQVTIPTRERIRHRSTDLTQGF